MALLTACTVSKRTYLPDGSQGYKISCRPYAFDVSRDQPRGRCLEQAGKTCGDRGYRTIDIEDHYMIIQCNSSAGSAPTSAVPTFINMSDNAIVARLLGKWECNASVDGAEMHASSQSVTTYSRGGKYAYNGTVSFLGKANDGALQFSVFHNGGWRVENGQLIGTPRNIQLRGLTAESEDVVDVFREEMPKVGDDVAVRFTALTDNYAEAVSAPDYAQTQYCRKKPSGDLVD